jgi:hypothetical protein
MLCRPDHAIEWTHPSYPVLSAFALAPARCDLAKTASVYQLLDTIKEIGLVSNVLGRVYIHATRNGAIRDIAHLPQSQSG